MRTSLHRKLVELAGHDHGDEGPDLPNLGEAAATCALCRAICEAYGLGYSTGYDDGYQQGSDDGFDEAIDDRRQS